MLFKKILLALLVMLGVCTSVRAAGQCPYLAIAQQKDQEGDTYMSQVAQGDCSAVDKAIQALQQYNQALDDAVHKCKGYKYTRQTNGDTSALRTEMMELCKQVADSKQPAAPQPAPVAKPQPGPATPTVSAFQPENAVSCGSDITGTGGPPQNTTSCLKKAQWTPAQPYNHSKDPVTFHSFNSGDILIALGQSLWSVPDESSPNGRRLEARPWDGESGIDIPNLDPQKDCALEDTTATVKPFKVRIECEIYRQGNRETAFENREESSRFMDYEACKAPSKIQINEGWEQQPLSYWKTNPDQPVGWCVIPGFGNHTETTMPLHEPGWISVAECTQQHEVLGADLTVSISPRGVRGCKVN